MSVVFYSSKIDKKVEIPAAKVCGYRINNPATKRGYSDGVRAGKNNGVVEQKFSRFSTKEERDTAGQKCIGNTNWLNYKRGNSFSKPISIEDQFTIDRPAFKIGSDYDKDSDDIGNNDIVNNRNGVGNKIIIRPAFMSPAPRARNIKQFRDLSTVAVSEFKDSPEYDNNRLENFTTVRMPDPTDLTWLREKERLSAILRTQFVGFQPDEVDALVERELEINPPLGRQQRTINRDVRRISALSALSVSDKLTAIERLSSQILASGRSERKDIIDELRGAINDISIANTLSITQLGSIQQTLLRAGNVRTRKELGIPEVIDYTYYSANVGLVIIFILSTLNDYAVNANDLTVENPIADYSRQPRANAPPADVFKIQQYGLPPISITSLSNKLKRTVGRGDRRFLFYLRLTERMRPGVISANSLLDMVADGTIDLTNLSFDLNQVPS